MLTLLCRSSPTFLVLLLRCRLTCVCWLFAGSLAFSRSAWLVCITSRIRPLSASGMKPLDSVCDPESKLHKLEGAQRLCGNSCTHRIVLLISSQPIRDVWFIRLLRPTLKEIVQVLKCLIFAHFVRSDFRPRGRQHAQCPLLNSLTTPNRTASISSLPSVRIV